MCKKKVHFQWNRKLQSEGKLRGNSTAMKNKCCAWMDIKTIRQKRLLPHLVGTGGFLFVSISMARIKVVKSKARRRTNCTSCLLGSTALVTRLLGRTDSFQILFPSVFVSLFIFTTESSAVAWHIRKQVTLVKQFSSSHLGSLPWTESLQIIPKDPKRVYPFWNPIFQAVKLSKKVNPF